MLNTALRPVRFGPAGRLRSSRTLSDDVLLDIAFNGVAYDYVTGAVAGKPDVSSSRSVITSAGTVAEVPAYQARYGADGLLNEPAGLDQLQYTDDLTNSYWSKGADVTVSGPEVLSPEGTLEGNKCVASGGDHTILATITVGGGIASTDQTASIWIYGDAGEDYTATLRVRGNGTTQEAENLSVTVKDGRWTRFSLTKNFTAAADGTVFSVWLYPCGERGVSSSRTCHVWIPNCLADSFLSSTIIGSGSGTTARVSDLGTTSFDFSYLDGRLASLLAGTDPMTIALFGTAHADASDLSGTHSLLTFNGDDSVGTRITTSPAFGYVDGVPNSPVGAAFNFSAGDNIAMVLSGTDSMTISSAINGVWSHATGNTFGGFTVGDDITFNKSGVIPISLSRLVVFNRALTTPEVEAL